MGYLSNLQQSLGALRGPDAESLEKINLLEEQLKTEREEVLRLKQEVTALEETRKKVNAVKEEAQDPVLGRMVADLGYKKIYLSSLESLANLPMWEKQRAYREERAKAIARDKKDSAFSSGFPGVLTACRFKGTNALGLLDGQHRLGAQRFMAQKGLSESGTESILVEVFDCETSQMADRLFVEINKAEPVKAIDMPGEVSPVIKQTIDQAVEELKYCHKDMFKVSAKCLAPHLHQDTMREALFEADICGRFELNDSKALLKWLMDVNEKLSKLSDDEWRARRGKGKKVGKAFEKALAKARDNHFFLGMDKIWLSMS